MLLAYIVKQLGKFIMSDLDYWQAYYSENPDPFQPSPFARAVSMRIDNKAGHLLELGCGNGRDALYFAGKIGLGVEAIDQCAEQVARLSKRYGMPNLAFVAADFSRYRATREIDYAYSRWSIHAVDAEAEHRSFAWVAKNMRPGGRFFIEARSIRDDLCGVGECVGAHAYMTDHYRRFIDPQVLRERLHAAGFSIVECVESRGLSAIGDNDPVLVRVVAERR